MSSLRKPTRGFLAFSARARPRVGVLGAAKIAPKALLQPGLGLIDVTCVAARDLARARDFAALHGIPTALGSYQELVERQDVDVVYVALPAALHFEWVRAALHAGKHVLCEKPFGVNAEQATFAVELAEAQGLLLMEAQHWRYHPLVAPLQDALISLGSLSHVRASFDGSIDLGDIRLEPSLGAGVLLDFGCYLLQWVEFVTGDAAPTIESAEVVRDARGVDLMVRATLRCRAGTSVELKCDMRPPIAFRAFIDLEGAGGRLHWENPLNGEDSELVVELAGRGAVSTRGRGPTTFRRQLETLVDCLRTGALPPTSGASIINTQRMLDALAVAIA